MTSESSAIQIPGKIVIREFDVVDGIPPEICAIHRWISAFESNYKNKDQRPPLRRKILKSMGVIRFAYEAGRYAWAIPEELMNEFSLLISFGFDNENFLPVISKHLNSRQPKYKEYLP